MTDDPSHDRRDESFVDRMPIVKAARGDRGAYQRLVLTFLICIPLFVLGLGLVAWANRPAPAKACVWVGSAGADACSQYMGDGGGGGNTVTSVAWPPYTGPLPTDCPTLDRLSEKLLAVAVGPNVPGEIMTDAMLEAMGHYRAVQDQQTLFGCPDPYTPAP